MFEVKKSSDATYLKKQVTGRCITLLEKGQFLAREKTKQSLKRELQNSG